jgi:inorganic phosphate transporter, PiT family
LLALAAGAVIYTLLHWLRLRMGVMKEMCLCVGEEQRVVPMPQPDGVFAAQAMPALTVAVDEPASCTQRYAGRLVGVRVGRVVDGLHFLSAGAVSFARGLNDTPKIAALLLVAGALDIRWGILAIALTMALGGLLHARRVADTMSHKITGMNPGQGCAANLATASLVTTASLHGLPVSTTHVSVGALLGIGVASHQAKWRTVIPVLLSWVVTLPCAALLAAVVFRVMAR